jgi:hypothetical protein
MGDRSYYTEMHGGTQGHTEKKSVLICDICGKKSEDRSAKMKIVTQRFTEKIYLCQSVKSVVKIETKVKR